MKLLTLILVILGGWASFASAKDLSDADITALISGKTGKWHTADGKISGSMQWNADGSQKVTGNFGKFDADEGHWRVDGGKLCSKWGKIRGGKVQDVGGGQFQQGGSIFTVD